MSGLDSVWQSKLLQRQKTNDDLVYAVLDNPELKAAWLEKSGPEIYAQARVARQRTCPISELIHPDGETRFLEYKSTLRWDVQLGEKASYLEDAVVKTIAGFANSFYGGTLLVGVTDDGGIYGLEDDYATFSKRGERGDRDLWGQHLKNLLDRLGKSAAALVDWEFFTIDGKDICRVSIDPSDHPVYEKKGDDRDLLVAHPGQHRPNRQRPRTRPSHRPTVGRLTWWWLTAASKRTAVPATVLSARRFWSSTSTRSSVALRAPGGRLACSPRRWLPTRAVRSHPADRMISILNSGRRAARIQSQFRSKCATCAHRARRDRSSLSGATTSATSSASSGSLSATSERTTGKDGLP